MKINIFIDTSSFYETGYDFRGNHTNTLKSLARLCKDKEIQLVLSSIVKKEIEIHLFEKRISYLSQLESVVNKIQKGIPSFDKELIEKVKKEYHSKCPLDPNLEDFQAFLKETNPVILPYHEITVTDLFSMYFQKEMIFKNDKKRKAKEFPDAVALLSLYEYIKLSNETFFVVSKDNDWSNQLESKSNIKWFGSISECLTSINKTRNSNSNLLELAYSFLDTHYDNLYEQIEQQVISDCSFMTYDYDGDVDEVTKFKCTDINIKNVLEDNEYVLFSGEFNMEVNLDLRLLDQTRSAWDQESKCYLFTEYKSEEAIVSYSHVYFEISILKKDLNCEQDFSEIDFSIDKINRNNYFEVSFEDIYGYQNF